MDQNNIVSRGHYAMRLLADDEFVAFVNELERDIKTVSFSKPSTDLAERESVYYQLKGLADVIGMMQSYASAAEEIVKSYNETLPTHDD